MKKVFSKTDGSVIQVRVKQERRDQIQWWDASLNQLMPKNHRVRAVWASVDSLDMADLHQKTRAIKGGRLAGQRHVLLDSRRYCVCLGGTDLILSGSMPSVASCLHRVFRCDLLA